MRLFVLRNMEYVCVGVMHSGQISRVACLSVHRIILTLVNVVRAVALKISVISFTMHYTFCYKSVLRLTKET